MSLLCLSIWSKAEGKTPSTFIQDSRIYSLVGVYNNKIIYKKKIDKIIE